MISNYIPNNYNNEEQLTELHKIRSHALTVKHNTEVLNSEKNNESAVVKAKMLLRHASEMISLSQVYLNLWIDLIERQKISLLKLH